MSAPPGTCRMCGRPATVRPLTRHHLVPQWWFRDQVARSRSGNPFPANSAHGANRAANIVMLCRPCHDLVDHGTVEERRPHRRMLRALLRRDELSFMRTVRGQAWLDNQYPPALSSGHGQEAADRPDPQHGRAA